jgi:hypothetical protein
VTARRKTDTNQKSIPPQLGGPCRNRTDEYRFCRPTPYHLANSPNLEDREGLEPSLLIACSVVWESLTSVLPVELPAQIWSRRSGSNRRPHPYQGCELPTVLRLQNGSRARIRTSIDGSKDRRPTVRRPGNKNLEHGAGLEPAKGSFADCRLDRFGIPCEIVNLNLEQAEGLEPPNGGLQNRCCAVEPRLRTSKNWLARKDSNLHLMGQSHPRLPIAPLAIRPILFPPRSTR